MSLIEKLTYYFEFPFVRYAFVVGILIALCASMLGVTLVLKRYSMIGDGLSHVAFGAIAIASVLKISSDMYVTLPVTIICAIVLLKTGAADSKIKGDAAIAMLSVGALAFGYLILNVTSTNSNVSGDVCTTLFGSTSILLLKDKDVYLTIVLAVVLLIVFVLFYHKIFAITFDESFAKATGIRTGFYNTLIAAISAVVIVLAMNLVGSLLVSALIIFPALSAMRFFKSFKAVIICSAVISVICATFGIIVSILANTPTGATIVAADIVMFLFFHVISLLKK